MHLCHTGLFWKMNIEHRTSNIECKNKHQYRTFNSYFCFFSAVLILVTKILINSSVSCKISSNSSGFLISGTRWISFNHCWVSLSSFNEIRSLYITIFMIHTEYLSSLYSRIVSLSFPIPHSMFNVGRSMFGVHLFTWYSDLLAWEISPNISFSFWLLDTV